MRSGELRTDRVTRHRPAGWNAHGSIWVGDDGDAMLAFDVETGERILCEGTVRDAVLGRLAGKELPAWLAATGPATGALAERMAATKARPLTRADVLRGRGFGLLFVELTARCNERCTHCYADASPERAEELSLDQVRAALDDARALGFASVQFTGGDPLLHRGLVEAVEHARSVGFTRVELFTNGLSLSTELLDRLAPMRPEFAFSVYSHDPEEHDAVTRVPGSHARTLRAIRRCLDRGLRARVGVTSMASTSGEAWQGGTKVRALLRELGLADDAIRITQSRSVGRGDAFGAEGEGYHGLVPGEADGKACVAADGTVHPCIFARDLPLGRLSERSLRDILEDDRPVRADLALGDRLREAALRLSCGECRVRDAMLADERRAGATVELRIPRS